MAKKQKFYAYSTQKGQGIATSWAECEKAVSGVPGARYKGFESEKEAKEWLEKGADYKVKHVALEKGIYFDAGTGAGEGVEISVTDEDGKSLLHKVLDKNDINARGFHLLGRENTNNYGELLACKYALEIAMGEGIKNIFGDSKLVIDFWSKGYIKKENLPSETVSLSMKVKDLRKKFEIEGGKVELISGGRNPADLGFHR